MANTISRGLVRTRFALRSAVCDQIRSIEGSILGQAVEISGFHDHLFDDRYARGPSRRRGIDNVHSFFGLSSGLWCQPFCLFGAQQHDENMFRLMMYAYKADAMLLVMRETGGCADYR
jgi:hypothetical protein